MCIRVLYVPVQFTGQIAKLPSTETEYCTYQLSLSHYVTGSQHSTSTVQLLLL